MMMKTLLTATLVGILALSAGACAQSTPQAYKPHLSVLAGELPPSQTPIDIANLQGSWSGTATLLRDVNPPGVKPNCSNTLQVNWRVDGADITGSSVNSTNIKMGYSGKIDGTGRWQVSVKPAKGGPARASGWFSGNRAIGFVRGGKGRDYCDFRIDLTKID